MAITPLPTPAPDINDPATFPGRASAQAAALPTLVSDINSAMLAFGPGAPYCGTAGGTVNARTLTTGLNLSALIEGQRVFFKVGATNTGSTTLNVDGRGALLCKTITGVNLPAGYLRTDAVTEAWYDGTNWIVDRLPEIGSNANGYYEKFANGKQSCWGTTTTSSSAAVSVTLPAPYPSNSSYRVSSQCLFTTALATTVRVDTKTATQFSLDAWNGTTGARITSNVDWITEGTWY